MDGSITLKMILQAAYTAMKQGAEINDFMYRDPQTDKLYITEAMFEQFGHELSPDDTIVIIPSEVTHG